MTIFDAIEALGLTNTRLDSATQTERVTAGDLITAEFMNGILDRLDALERRLKRIEDGLGGKPSHTLPTIIPTTITMPTVTFQTRIIDTFRHATLVTPTRMPNQDFGTFVATLFRPPEEEEFDLGQFVVSSDKGIFPPESEVTALPGIGEKEKELLDKANIKNVSDFAQMDAKLLAKTLDLKTEEAEALVGMANNVVIKQQFRG